MKYEALSLAQDEYIQLENDIAHQKEGSGLAGAVLNTLERGRLVLTNKCLVFQRSVSILSKRSEQLCFPLNQIKVTDDVVQIKPAKSDRADSAYRLTIYLIDHQEVFYFPLKTPFTVIKQWVQEINRSLTGTPSGWHPEDIGLVDVKKAIGVIKQSATSAASATKDATENLLESASPIAKNAFQVAKPLIPVAAAVATAVPSPAGKAAGAALRTIDALAKRDEAAESILSTDHVQTAETRDSPSFDTQIPQSNSSRSFLIAGSLRRRNSTPRNTTC